MEGAYRQFVFGTRSNEIGETGLREASEESDTRQLPKLETTLTNQTRFLWNLETVPRQTFSNPNTLSFDTFYSDFRGFSLGFVQSGVFSTHLHH